MFLIKQSVVASKWWKAKFLLLFYKCDMIGALRNRRECSCCCGCCCSVTKSCPSLCIPLNCSTPGFCLSLSPWVCSNSCLSSRWSHPIISSSVIPFSSCLQSFPAPGSFPMSQFFVSGGQSIGASSSASVLPMNIHSWFLLGLTSLISLLSKGLSRVFSWAEAKWL